MAKPKVTITKGKVNGPRRFMIFGEPGVGKTFFVAQAENPILIDGDHGADELGTDRFKIDTWEEVHSAIDWLMENKHEYKTLGIDTLDSLEEMLHLYICKKFNKSNLSDFPFGGGYKEALLEWRRLISRLEKLQREKHMHVVMLAHVIVKEEGNPMGEDFDRFTMKMYGKAVGLLRAWCSLMAFAAWEIVVSKDKATKKVKGQATGNRVLFTEKRAGFDAKNRYGMPSKVALDWKTVFQLSEKAFDNEEDRIVELREQIKSLVPLMPEDKQDAINDYLRDQTLNMLDLQTTLNKMNIIIAESQSEDEEEQTQEQAPTESGETAESAGGEGQGE